MNRCMTTCPSNQVYSAVPLLRELFNSKGEGNLINCWASLIAQLVKNLPAMQETQFSPWVGKMPWRREWLPIPVFLPGEFHGQRSLASYSPWGCKELGMTEWLTCWQSYCQGLSVAWQAVGPDLVIWVHMGLSDACLELQCAQNHS